MHLLRRSACALLKEGATLGWTRARPSGRLALVVHELVLALLAQELVHDGLEVGDRREDGLCLAVAIDVD